MLRLAFRAALFDGSVYEEIREKQETAFSALGVVLVAGIAFGMGIWSQTQDASQQGFRMDESLNLFLSISCIFSSWVIWTVFVWLLGRLLFAGREGYRTSLRSLGVCYLPIALWLMIGLPTVGAMLFMLGAIWALASAVVAVKRIHDISWWKAGVTAAIGWLWAVILMPLFLVILPIISAASA